MALEKATEVFVTDPSEVIELIKIGQENQAIGSTAMNEKSSRSHVVFILTLTQ